MSKLSDHKIGAILSGDKSLMKKLMSGKYEPFSRKAEEEFRRLNEKMDHLPERVKSVVRKGGENEGS